MANSEAGSSSDAARASGGEYQVFLNFRGPDTRYGFTDFLYYGLVDVGVRVFRDEEELRVGEVIGGNLLRAINNSKIYIPIFSQTYASSKWCLRELAHIVENVSKSESQKSIFPIFLDVEPEDIKLKTSRYSDALLEHEKKLPLEVKVWRKALAEVDEIKGWNVKKDESQATIVKLVVERVLEKLKLKQRLVPEHLVGLDDRVKRLTELLDVNHRDVRLIGIYGMGGIGKTTVAKVVFNELSSHFGKCSSFLENVREKMSTEDGIVQLQKKLLSDIVDSGSAGGVQDVEQGMRRIGEVLSTKKVLVVLDDADNKDHIKRLIGNNSLHLGSRIIITTRNKTILQGQEFKDEIILYEMLKMHDDHALELFCWHAFGKRFPLDDFYWLSKAIVSDIGGLPLTVNLIGSLLNRKDKAFWKEIMIKLRNVPKEEILNKLRISYDVLEEHQRQIFLDIACFFVNEKKTDAMYMWADCGFFPVIGIEVLTNRCLIKILHDDTFWMHDQLIDMGRRIVHQESPSDLGKRSRLWIAEEALDIIRTEERKDKVQALQIDKFVPPLCRRPMGTTKEGFEKFPLLSKLWIAEEAHDIIRNEELQRKDKVQAHLIDKSSPLITNEEFERLPNLRFLKSNCISFVGDFAKCHSKLKWISWNNLCAFKANNMYLEHLVVFKLERSSFKDDSKEWDLIKRARNLKVLSLTMCSRITTIPDLSGCLGLERFTLAECKSLKRIESYIGKLQFLIELEIESCQDLTDLPEEVGALGKLKRFSVQRCPRLRELPGSLGNLTSLEELDLSGTCIRELPNSIGKLKSLKELDLSRTSIRELPNSIGKLKSLEELNLSMSTIRELPNSIGKLKSLRVLRFTSWCSWYSRGNSHAWHLPRNISMLVKLEELDLSGQDGMTGKIPAGIGELSSLKILNLASTGICRIPNTINMLHHLQMLDLSDCHEIQELPKLPTSLTCLRIQSETLLSVPNLSDLTSLDELLLSNYKIAGQELKRLMGCKLRWNEGLSKLKKLELCLPDVLAPLELADLPHMEFLFLRGLDLKPLLQLPSARNWRCLSFLQINDCDVESIPLEGLPRLEKLFVDDCIRLQRLTIPSKELQELQLLMVSSCQELVEIEVKDPSESVKILIVNECISLAIISGLSYLKKLKKVNIQCCHVLTNVEGLDELESLEDLIVDSHMAFGRLIDASCTKIPNDCLVYIDKCGLYKQEVVPAFTNTKPHSSEDIAKNLYIKPSYIMRLKLYRELILQAEFIRDLWSLIKLEIVNCESFKYLPEEVGTLVNLKCFSLRGCSELGELPSSIGNLTSLMELDLSQMSITELPNSIEKLKSLRVLRLEQLTARYMDVGQFLSGISMLVNLEELNLSVSTKKKSDIPIGIGVLSSLRILTLAFLNICRIPRTINMLHHLQTLNLRHCDEIQELPELPTSLTCLFLISKSLRLVPNLSNLTNLVELELGDHSDDTKTSNLVTGCNLRWIERLSRLEKLDLNLLNIPIPLELASLSHLKELVLTNLDLKPPMQFPSFNRSWRNLSTSGLFSCEAEDILAIPLGGLPQLERFTVEDCVQLQRLSISLGLTKLRQVKVSKCPKLVEIQVGALTKSLEDLIINNCKSLTRIRGLSYLKNLKRLAIRWCKVLANVEGLGELESLETLKVRGCTSLRRFIDASLTKIPDDCKLSIATCGNSIRDSKEGMSLNRYREEILRNTSSKDEAERDVSSPDEDSDSGPDVDWAYCPHADWDFASVNESETDGSSSIDDFQSEEGNAECFEATGNGRQMKDERVGHSGDVKGGKTTSMENRKEKDESGEPVDQNDVRSSWQRGEGVEHHESACKATTEVEDEGDLYSVKRDRIVEANRTPTKTGRGSGTKSSSNPGTDPAERGRGRGIASSSKNSEGLRLGRDAASTSDKGKASNSGRSISLMSQSSPTLTSGRDAILSSGRGRGSSSRRDTTNMDTSSSSRRCIASRSRSSSTLSRGRGRGSTSIKGTTVSLGRGTTEMGASLRSGADKGSSNPRSSTTSSIGRGRGLTSEKGATVNSGRGKTLSLGRGATGMGTSLRSGTDKGSSSAKTEPQTSSS